MGNGLFEKKAGYKKILAPVDFSDCSREGLRYAMKFAECFGAKVIVLHVISLPYPYITDSRCSAAHGATYGKTRRAKCKDF